MTTVNNQQQLKKVAAKTEEQPIEPNHEVSKAAPNPFDEVQVRARMAYQSYLKAQTAVAHAYRERDRQDQEAYKSIEQQAYKAYEDGLEKALKVREKTEQEAEETYKKAREKAAKDYLESVRQMLVVCKETIDEAWKSSRETSEQMWTLFQAENMSPQK